MENMYKIKADLLLEIDKTLKRSTKAINILQRAHSNKIIFPELQKDIQDLISKIESRYAVIEWIDIDARNKELNRIKREAEKDWEGRKIG